MHVLPYILFSPDHPPPHPERMTEVTANNNKKTSQPANQDDHETADNESLVTQAQATADAAFRPPPSILNASDPQILMQAVDGPSLVDYEGKESVYVGRSVPVAAGAQLSIPMDVKTPGSVVEYSLQVHQMDIGLRIVAIREEGEAVVREADSRITSSSQKFLIGSVPCKIVFTLDNSYSWMREKIVTYKITVRPPTAESLQEGRRRRAQACLTLLQQDAKDKREQLQATASQPQELELKIQRLQQELKTQQQALEVLQKERKWLLEHEKLRQQQVNLLQDRLQRGWPDEPKNIKKKSSFF